jgi:DNA-binding winged helix-turn-helix (wHTH) protein
MSSQPIQVQQSIRFADDFELDIRRGKHILKMERIPLEILTLLLERHGEIVAHSDIVARVWGSDVFLDTENSIRGAIRKIRQVLKDDSEQPRFIETVTGHGYRFIAPVMENERENPESGRDRPVADPQPTPNFISELDGWL